MDRVISVREMDSLGCIGLWTTSKELATRGSLWGLDHGVRKSLDSRVIRGMLSKKVHNITLEPQLTQSPNFIVLEPSSIHSFKSAHWRSRMAESLEFVNVVTTAL